jgi:prophage DNA circulation protein
VSPFIATYIFAANLDTEKYVKRLFGLVKTNIQDEWQRLDELTKEETAMTVASNFKATSDVYDGVKTIKEVTNGVDGKVTAIEGLVQIASGEVKAAKVLMQGMDDNVKANRDLTESVYGNVERLMEVAQDLNCNVKTESEQTAQVTRSIKIGAHSSLIYRK